LISLPLGSGLFSSYRATGQDLGLCLILILLAILGPRVSVRSRERIYLAIGGILHLWVLGPTLTAVYLGFLVFVLACFRAGKWVAPLPIILLPIFLTGILFKKELVPFQPAPLAQFVCFAQWLRIWAWYVDLRDGLLKPADQSEEKFFFFFLLPSFAPNFLSANFLVLSPAAFFKSRVENPPASLVWAGIRLLALSVLYANFTAILQKFHVSLQSQSLTSLVSAWSRGEKIPAHELWRVIYIEQLNVFLQFASISHCRIGFLNLMGYNVPPQFNKPWAALNFSDLWRRFSLHYRDFLSRVFFSRPFLILHRLPGSLRISFSIFIAAGVGNFLVHLYFHALSGGLPAIQASTLKSWPYYIILSFLIAMSTQWRPGKKSQRRTWEWGLGLPRNILQAFVTVSIFCLIHVFARHSEGTTNQHSLEILLTALGLR